MGRCPRTCEEGGQTRTAEEMSVFNIHPRSSTIRTLPDNLYLGLIVVARSEFEVVTATSKNSPASSSRLQHLIPELSKAIEIENTYAEDVFQAQTCLAWVYWIDEQYKLVAATVPSSLPTTVNSTTEKQGTLRQWTQVCIFKSAYIGGEYAIVLMAVLKC